MDVKGVALIAPAFNSLLGSLTPDELKTETGGTVLRFARFARVSHIRLLVCLEDAQEDRRAEEDMACSPDRELEQNPHETSNDNYYFLTS